MGRVILLTLLLSGCSWFTKTEVREVPEVPPECYEERTPAPGVVGTELACLSDEAFERLRMRDLILRQEIKDYEDMCEQLIEANEQYE